MLFRCYIQNYDGVARFSALSIHPNVYLCILNIWYLSYFCAHQLKNNILPTLLLCHYDMGLFEYVKNICFSVIKHSNTLRKQNKFLYHTILTAIDQARMFYYVTPKKKKAI